ncbi:uncharacterized protein MELLADRAFT_91309 [Melampsora larici-populina 98AG31]|uniref:Uncharacterized protein n=1 Tax=Melampsora larici-populina (strain 98AG31 / pathotype 3-4-7) TaxID=747676 RepID=F4RYK5_MELLP|nr:uncharacterized protein MELLADRAFT_91309 [Melampsora larici-populina 98AG31]EGG02488.1 hypothetical protein MELLADRAFT_91309 [Melampsora larici-populina 98AG31]
MGTESALVTPRRVANSSTTTATKADFPEQGPKISSHQLPIQTQCTMPTPPRCLATYPHARWAQPPPNPKIKPQKPRKAATAKNSTDIKHTKTTFIPLKHVETSPSFNIQFNQPLTRPDVTGTHSTVSSITTNTIDSMIANIPRRPHAMSPGRQHKALTLTDAILSDLDSLPTGPHVPTITNPEIPNLPTLFTCEQQVSANIYHAHFEAIPHIALVTSDKPVQSPDGLYASVLMQTYELAA